MEQGVRPRTLPGANPESPGELGTPKAGGAIGILSGILGSILQYAAFCKISEDLNKAMNCDKLELQVRWWAQLSAMIGATMETLGKLLAKIPTWAMEGEMVAGLTLGILKYGGAALGAAGGFISAGMDFVKWHEEKSKGHYGLAACYFISGSVGAAIGILAIATAFGASIPVWGWALAIAAFLIGQLISAIKPDKIQNWLEQCCWGTGKRFGTMGMEQKQLGLATAS